MPSGFKTFSTGEVLTAADVNNYLMEQSICVFADGTARDAGITSPEDGQFVFLSGSSTLQFYGSSSWNNFIGEGDITGVTAGNGLSGGGTSGAVSLALDLNELSAATVNVAADSVAIVDADDNSSKKESISDLSTAISGGGLTSTSGVIAVDPSDLADGSGITVDVANDLLILEDVTDGTVYKVKPNQIASGGGTSGAFVLAMS